MNEQDIQTLVDNAVALHREIATKTEQLKTLKADLVRHARAHPEALAATESGGKRWSAKGSGGCIARVNFPAASLVSEIEPNGEIAQQAHTIAGDHFRKLFATVKSYQLVDDFRAEAAALLPASKAEALLKICESESSPRVSFETTARPVGAAAA